MEAIVAQFNVAGMTAEQYENTLNDLGGRPGIGCMCHVAVKQPNGMMVIDVWESQEAFDEFGKILIPILQKNGVTPVQPVLMPVYNVMAGAPAAVH